MDIAEETSRVALDLSNLKVLAVVEASLWVVKTSLKRSLQTPLATALITISSPAWVGECDARWTTFTKGSLVNVGGGECGRLILAAEAVELDVVTDDIVSLVDAKIVVANGAL